MLLYSSFAVVFISVVAGPWVTDATEEQCQNAAALQNQLTCAITQANGTCGWIVYNSSSNLSWKIDGDSTFMVEIGNTVYGTVQLRSPIICATITGLSTLTFKYNIQNNNCEQSVFLDGDSCNTTLWSTSQSTSNTYAWSPNIAIDNQIFNFHIVLQSRRLGVEYCQFKLDDIAFNYTGQRNGSILPSTDGASPGCRLPGEGTSVSGSPGGASSSGVLSGGGIAGIIVSLVVVIVVLAIVFVLLRRRKTGRKLPFLKLFGRLRTIIQTSFGSATDTHAAERTIRPVIDGPYPEITSESEPPPKTKDYYSVPSDFHNGKKEHPENSTHYAVSNVPESSNYYSIPRDSDDATGAPGGSKTNPGYSAEDDGGYSTPDDIDRLEMDRRKTNTTQNARSEQKGAAGDSYNKISFQPPRPGSAHKAADTYHHINPLEHADTGTGDHQDDDQEYKVPRSDDAEYSLATNPGDPYDRPPTTPTGNIQKPDLTGKREAPGANNADYNHLNLKNGGSSPAGATSAKRNGQGQVVYSHLEGQGQGDNYNRVDLDGLGGGKQTGDGSGPYNHLCD